MTAEEWANKFIRVQYGYCQSPAYAWGPGYDEDRKPLNYPQLVIQLPQPRDERDKVEIGLKAFMTDVFRQVQEDAVRQFAEKMTIVGGDPDLLPPGVYHAKGNDWNPLCGGSDDEGVSSASRYVNCQACLNIMAANIFPAKPIEHNGV